MTLLFCKNCGHSEEHHEDSCRIHGCPCIRWEDKKRLNTKESEPVRIRIENLLFKPNAVSGMNHLVVMSQTYFYRAGVLDGVPIVVKREGENFRILDGRHRVVASLLAGRPDVLAVIEE